MTAIITSTETIEAMLLLNLNLFSKKLEKGSNNNASNIEVSNGASNV